MTLTPLNCERRSPDELEPGDWLSVHIFYAADRGPLLSRCVRPLVERLRADELISGYFFMRHWLEGSHLRLRLMPRFDRLETVCDIVEHDVRSFLDQEPSVYDPERDFPDELYKERFLNEFTEEQWTERYGVGTTMPRHPNDTFGYFEYVPELTRYGGRHGVELAEWHAERSSDLVIDLLESDNAHVRTVRLGLAMQLMLTTALVFTGDPRHTADLFSTYLRSWKRMYGPEYERYEQGYRQMASTLAARVERIHEAVVGDRSDGVPEFVPAWTRQCAHMRQRLNEAAADGRLTHPATGETLTALTTADDTSALSSLVLSYLHLANNRLGITVSSENYLSYVLHRSLEEQFLG